MIKNKKIWLTLATISAVGFVPATVLACGSNKSEVKKSEVTANVASFKVVEGSNIVSDTKIHLKDFTSAKKPAKDQILKLIIGRKHENHLDDEKDASYTVKGIANEEIVFSFNGLKLAEEDNSTATEATYKIHSLWLNGEEVEIANKDTFEFKIYDKLENSLIAHIKKTISEIEELTKTETNLKDQDKVTLEELKEIFSIYKLINSPDQIDAKITEFTSKISEEAKKTTKKNDLDKIKAQATKLKEAFETTDAAKLTHLITSVEAALTKIETKLKSAITNTQETQADQPAAENGEPSDMQKDAMMAKSSGAQGGKDKKNMSQNEQSDSSSDMMDASKAKDAMMAKPSGAQGGKDKKNMSQNEQSDSSSDMMDASKAKDAMMAKPSGAQGGKDKKNMSQNEQSDSSSDMMDASKAKDANGSTGTDAQPNNSMDSSSAMLNSDKSNR